jgi:tetratricopeptide (TPR) repeat protein
LYGGFVVKKGFWKKLLIFVAFIIVTIVLFKISVLYTIMFLSALAALFIFLKRAAILALVGRTNYYKGNMEKGLVWLKRAYKTGVSKPKTVVSYAYLLLKTGNIKEAENILEKLLRSRLEADDRMLAKSNMALVEWKKDNLDKAISTLKEVIGEFETSNIYGSLGYMLIQKGDLDEALEFNLKAQDYNSSNTIILDNLGLNYYLMEDYDKAYNIYEDLMKKNPTFPEAYYNYGLVLKARNETEKALEMAKKALNYSTSFLSTIKKEYIDKLISDLETPGGVETLMID